MTTLPDDVRPPELHVASSNRSSIHHAWMIPLGGLIRWYVFKRTTSTATSNRTSAEQAESEVKLMYVQSECSMEGTRNKILRALCAIDGVDAPTENDKWIEVFIVVENESLNEEERVQLLQQGFANSCDKRGIVLKIEDSPGEGHARRHETWKTVRVPPWAVKKPYYLQVCNRSPIALSGEITIDGQQVAWNAPVPALQTRTIKPNSHVFRNHKWVLQPAHKLKLADVVVSGNAQQQPTQQAPTSTRIDPRYNGVQPKDHGERGVCSFPGWTFTGSQESSCVEYFEKRVNLGIVKLDFYYATGEVKTVLEHPSTGHIQLLQKCKITPELHEQIMKNPRARHFGYQARDETAAGQSQHVNGDNIVAMDVDEDTSEATPESARQAMMVGTPSKLVFPAKNEAYNFEVDGHVNRKTAMMELKETEELKIWTEAARKDWACVEAKFYMAVPRQRTGRIFKQARKDQKVPEALQVMTPIVDIKASEKAVLATTFQATVPAQPKLSSRERMERISGLNDQPECKADPVFGCKLYYRPESQGNADGGMDDEVDLADKLLQNTNVALDEYKAEKMQQVYMWHSDNKALDVAEADIALHTCKGGIENAPDLLSIDSFVEKYWDWLQPQE